MIVQIILGIWFKIWSDILHRIFEKKKRKQDIWKK